MLDDIDDVESNTFNIIRKVLINEFRNVHLHNLVETLGDVDSLHIQYIKKNFYTDKTITTTLRDKIFDLYAQEIVEEFSEP